MKEVTATHFAGEKTIAALRGRGPNGGAPTNPGGAIPYPMRVERSETTARSKPSHLSENLTHLLMKEVTRRVNRCGMEWIAGDHWLLADINRKRERNPAVE